MTSLIPVQYSTKFSSQEISEILIIFIIMTHNMSFTSSQDGKKVKVLAFGVGPSIREEDLNVMAGEKNWFYVEDFADMRERIPDILGHACNETVSNPLP